MTTITIDEAGRVTLPEDVREALGLSEDTLLDLEVRGDDDGREIVLRHHIPEEDEWAYTKENRDAIRRAEADYAAGRVYRMSRAELEALAPVSKDPIEDD